MNLIQTDRGFEVLEHDVYASQPPAKSTIVQQSCVIRSFAGAYAFPGSSCLWIGKDHHLDRNEVRELVGFLQQWLETGTLSLPPKDEEEQRKSMMSHSDGFAIRLGNGEELTG